MCAELNIVMNDENEVTSDAINITITGTSPVNGVRIDPATTTVNICEGLLLESSVDSFMT